MSTPIICYNNKFYFEDEIPLEFNNRAFKFGDSFFESVRCNGNYPIHFSYHYKRMIKALISLKMDIASLPTQDKFENLIKSLLKQNKLFGASRVRIEVLRAGKGLYTPIENSTSFVMECSKLDTQNFELNDRGLLVGDYTEIKKSYNPISFFKSGNALNYVMASFAKKEQNVNDCFLYNDAGKIIEATSSNLFWVKDGIFYTPSVYSGCVSGVMRQRLIDLINASQFTNVVEESGISPEELLTVDEIFLCNAIQGIQWVVGYGNKRYFNQYTKKLHNLLNANTF